MCTMCVLIIIKYAYPMKKRKIFFHYEVLLFIFSQCHRHRSSSYKSCNESRSVVLCMRTVYNDVIMCTRKSQCACVTILCCCFGRCLVCTDVMVDSLEDQGLTLRWVRRSNTGKHSWKIDKQTYLTYIPG